MMHPKMAHMTSATAFVERVRESRRKTADLVDAGEGVRLRVPVGGRGDGSVHHPPVICTNAREFNHSRSRTGRRRRVTGACECTYILGQDVKQMNRKPEL